MPIHNFPLWSQKQYQNKIMSAQKTSSTGYSKMQATFIASSTLKRNRRYLDIEKLNHQLSHENIKRRKPRNTSNSVRNKINRSFSSSTAALTERLGRDINKYKQRVTSAQRPKTAQSFYSAQENTPSEKNIRGVGIGQHLSREQYYKIRSKPVQDERLFNNFKLEIPDEVHTVDMSRGPQRNFDNSLKYINKDIEYNTQNLYQEYYYKRTTMDCRLHYKKQKEQERYFFIPKREDNKPATELSPKAVKKAAETVELRRNIDSFYMNSGRQLPCQMDQRVGTNLTSHWRNESDVIQRPRPEYSVRQMKDKLFEERKERISNSKKPHFERGDLCDRKYFIVTGQC